MAYTGPGDLQTFRGWWGLRAYSAATSGNNCCDVSSTIGGSITTIKTLANGNFDTASALSALGGTTGFISQFYDQTGNGWNLAAATPSTDSCAITLNVLQGGTLPVIGFIAPSGQFGTPSSSMQNASFTALTNPWTIVAALEEISTSSTPPQILAANAVGGSGAQSVQFTSVNGQVNLSDFFSSDPQTITTSAWHRIIGIDNGASPNSKIYVDGIANNITSGGTSGFPSSGTGLYAGSSLGGGVWNAVEIGIASGAFSPTDAANIDSNINNYWFVAAQTGINIWPYKV